MEMLLFVWGGAQAKRHTHKTVEEIWTLSRNTIERDTVPAFNKIMTDFKDGFPSGKDAEWTLTDLTRVPPSLFIGNGLKQTGLFIMNR